MVAQARSRLLRCTQDDKHLEDNFAAGDGKHLGRSFAMLSRSFAMLGQMFSGQFYFARSIQEETTMRKGIVVAVLGLGMVVAVASGQETTKKSAPPKPAVSPSQVLLENWNDVGRKLIAMAEDFPEDKYDFKPVPAQRSFAEQLLHAAGANYYFTNPVIGQKPPAGEDPKRDQYKTKADIV